MGGEPGDEASIYCDCHFLQLVIFWNELFSKQPMQIYVINSVYFQFCWWITLLCKRSASPSYQTCIVRIINTSYKIFPENILVQKVYTKTLLISALDCLPEEWFSKCSRLTACRTSSVFSCYIPKVMVRYSPVSVPLRKKVTVYKHMRDPLHITLLVN